MKNPHGSDRAPPRREWRIKKLGRLAAYCLVVFLGLGVLAARSVYGDARAAALALGHELGRMGDVGEGRPLLLNGEPIFMASTTEALTVQEVLDRTEARCWEESAGLLPTAPESTGPAWFAKAVLDRAPHEVTKGRAAGILRETQGDTGAVACLGRAPGTPVGGIREVLGRLSELVATGDLSKLGLLRYVYAEKTSAGKTHVLVVWTNGPFNFHRLLPAATGDAPGTDPDNAPRPPRAHRLLSAGIEGVPYGVRVYDTEASPTEVVATYDEQMLARGWQPTYGHPQDGEFQRAFSREGVDLIVLAAPDREHTVVSLIEMRSGASDVRGIP